MRRRGLDLLISVVFLIALGLVVLATAPVLFSQDQTPANNTYSTNQSFEFNFSITASNLTDLIYNWDGTNYSIYNDSLVLMLNFDNISSLGENSTYVVDHSIYGNNGTLRNGSVVNSTGKYSGGIHFDGVDDLVEIEDSSTLDVYPEFTLSLWEKTSVDRDVTVTWGQMIIGRGTYGDPENTLEMRIRATGDTAIFSYEYGSGTNSNYAIGTTDIADGEWHHIVGRLDGSTCKVFVDGVEEGSVSCTNAPGPFSDRYYLAKALNSSIENMEHFNGSLDDVRIWNRSLSAEEIYQIYASNLRKFDTDRWEFYVNQSKNATDLLDDGVYAYSLDAINSSSNVNQSGNLFLTVDTVNPLISFDSSTPANGTITSNTSFEVNATVNETNLGNLTYNWNGTDYTIYDDSLVLMANFENLTSLGENSTKVVDLSNSGNNGTTNASISTGVSGYYGGGIEFDGVTDILNFGNDSSLDFSDFTIALWVYPKDWGGTTAPGIISKRDTYGGMDWELFYSNGDNGPCSNEICFWFGNSGSSQTLGDLDANLSLNTWTHLILTRSGNDFTVYLDGVDQGTETEAGSFPTGDSVRLGHLGGGSGETYFNGTMDELRIYNRTIGDDEAYQIYASNLRKFDTDKWAFYVSQSKNATDGLDDGTYTYNLSVIDLASSSNNTETRDIIIYNPTLVSFDSSTPANGTVTRNTSFEINATINESSLSEFIYNWNGTNYTIFNDSLVLMMNFDNVSAIGENSTRVVDLSSSSNDATLFERALSNTSQGKYDSGLHFNGSYGSYGEINNSDSLAIDSDYTIAFWINPDSSLQSIWRPILCKMQGVTYTADICDYGLWIASNNNNYHLRMDDDTLNWGSVSYDTWQHLAIVWDQSAHDVYFYKDGVLVTTDTSNFPDDLVQSGFDLHIGDTRNSLEYFKGAMDNLMIWNRSMSQDEIYQIYASNLRKFDTDKWAFYVNQSKNATDGLDEGTYNYSLSITDSDSNFNSTETRDFIISDPTLVSFDSSTPANGTVTTNTSFEINANINESSLSEFIYNWNGTNYTFYNDSLVLMYNLDNVSSLGENDTLVKDLSTYGNNGNVTGANVTSSGKFGGAFDFDGTDDQIVIDSTFGINIENFAIMLWANLDSASEGGSFVKIGGTSPNNGFAVGVGDTSFDTTGNNLVVLYEGTRWIDTGITIGTGWHHIGLVVDSDGYPNTYLDGSLVYSDSTGSGSSPKSSVTYIGGYTGAGAENRFTDVILDEVSIHNRSLSSDEVYQIYASNLRKFDTDKWAFYVNQSGNASADLTNGTYNYSLSIIDSESNFNSTETRFITLGSSSPIPSPSPSPSSSGSSSGGGGGGGSGYDPRYASARTVYEAQSGQAAFDLGQLGPGRQEYDAEKEREVAEKKEKDSGESIFEKIFKSEKREEAEDQKEEEAFFHEELRKNSRNAFLLILAVLAAGFLGGFFYRRRRKKEDEDKNYPFKSEGL